MNRFWKTFFASGLATLIVGGILVILLVFGFSSVLGSFFEPQESDFKLKNGTVLHLDLSAPLTDHRQSPDHPFDFGVPQTTGLYELLLTIDEAKEDDRIAGILIEPNVEHIGLASLSEIREALEDFKKSGKFVVAYGENYGQKGVYLASVADEVYMLPTGRVDLRGLSANLIYLKSMFDRLGVEMQVIRGPNNKYKSAVEPLLTESMSEENREQIGAILEDGWAEISRALISSRGVDSARLELVADSVLLRSAQDAVEEGIIDGLKYWDEIRVMMAQRTDMDDDNEPRLFSFERYMRQYKPSAKLNNKNDDAQIAVIFAQGDIVSGDQKRAVISSGHIARQLRKARLDDDIKAVVFRVNSGGGSALASDVIWREASLIAKEKTLVVSMGDYAASGGYMISCPADVILAQPNTITGSIGVFGVIPYTGKFMEEKLGISFDQVTTHSHSTLALNKKLTEHEMVVIQGVVDDIYQDFIDKVSLGRDGLDSKDVDSVGRGRVWTGQDAHKIGLVDEIGGLKQAIARAAEMVGADEDDVRILPQRKEDKWMEMVNQILDDQDDSYEEQAAERMSSTLYQNLLRLHRLAGTLETWDVYQSRVPFQVEIR